MRLQQHFDSFDDMLQRHGQAKKLFEESAKYSEKGF